LDYILGAHVSFAEFECLHEFVHNSDHHPVSAVVRPSLRLPDNSIKYWRLRTERLADKEYYDSYRDAFDVLTEPLQEALLNINTAASVTRSSPQHLRRQLVDRLELKLVSSITDCASSVLGRKKVPVVPYHGKRSLPSHEYLDAKARLSRNYSLLRAFGSLGPEHEVIAGLLTSCDDLKSTLASLEARDQTSAYTEWKSEWCNLSATQRVKILNRTMRKKASTGSSLPTTPSALEAYREHFRGQFTNSFEIPEYAPSLPGPDDDTDSVLLGASLFDEVVVHQHVLRSPAGKAPGLTGLSADLLHPIADMVAPILASLFSIYFYLDVVPSSWKRSLICPIPKKGDLSMISNYRPISLTEVTRKIYEMCLLDRLKAVTPLSREQGGFRECRSTIDQIQALGLVVDQSKQDGKKVHLAFLDISLRLRPKSRALASL
jgi:hypothetical protein